MTGVHFKKQGIHIYNIYSICVVKGDNKYIIYIKMCQRLNGDSYLFMIYREKGIIKYEKHRTYRN